ncbi:MAG: hypothetical protein Q9192_000870 [Flavoplaca navasiana]
MTPSRPLIHSLNHVLTPPLTFSQSTSGTHQNGLPAHSDHSSSTLTPHPLPASGTTHPQQLEIPPKTSSTRQSPRPKKKKQRSYVKQRTQRNIDVIDATFAVCKGSAKAGATRALAYPVHEVDKGHCLVPATKSDYNVVRKLKRKTSARAATLRFIRSTKVPGYSRRTSCISIGMPGSIHETLKNVDDKIFGVLDAQNWTYKGEPLEIACTGSEDCKLKFPNRQCIIQQADSSLRHPDAKLPFLVVEVAYSQTMKSVKKTVHYWLQGSKQHLKYVIVLRVDNTSSSLRVFADVIKPRAVDANVPGHPLGFRVEEDYVLNNVEVYPRVPSENFRIYYGEVLPKDWEIPAENSSVFATINLSLFHGQALRAVVNRKAVEEQDDDSSDCNSDQDETPSTPTESEKSVPVGETRSEDAAEDSSSEYIPDSSDDDEPHVGSHRKRKGK